MTKEEPEAQFGARVKARRNELGLSRSEVEDRGGPPAITMAKVERGGVRSPSSTTLARLDTALGWAAGSAARLHATGAAPVSLDSVGDAATAARRNTVLTADPGAPLTVARIRELADLSRRLSDHAASRPQDAELSEIVAAVRTAVDRLLRTWLIAAVQASVDEPGTRPQDPLLDIILSQYLSVPPADELSSDDRDDVFYLRWLIGAVDLNRDVDDNQTLRARMLRRWAGARSES